MKSISHITAILILSLVISNTSWARSTFDLAHCMSFGNPAIPANIENLYGPTPVTGVSGNGSLSISVNNEGTLTGLKWPSPSFYDHVKYLTTARDEERWGALENEGVFSGIIWKTNGEQKFFWLRDAKVEAQFFSSETSDTIVTQYFHEESGLRIKVSDTVATEKDIFERKHQISTETEKNIEEVYLLAYANFNPTVRKMSLAPLWDGCLDQYHDGQVTWHENHDALEFKEERNALFSDDDFAVSISMAWSTASYQHDLGHDRYYLSFLSSKDKDAYSYATTHKGNLGNRNELSWATQVNGAISTKVNWINGEGESSLLITLAQETDSSLALLEHARIQHSDIIKNKHQYWNNWLSNARLPNTDNPAIIEHSYRTLISLAQAIDKNTGAIVASLSVQPPYAFDWVRDGAFFNEVLYAAGHPELVEKHNYFYARTIVTNNQRPEYAWFTPKGNWPMNMYADGSTGGPIPFEIDETGLGLWTLVRHYEITQDKAYLQKVWPAIEAAAEFLTEWKSDNGLPRPAFEDDNIELPNPPTLVSSAPVLLGLRHATLAAKALGEKDFEQRWQSRADELNRAMEQHYFKNDEYIGEQNGGVDYLIWPMQYKSPAHPAIQQLVETRWQKVAPSFEMPNGNRERGQYEAKALLAIASVWSETNPEKLGKVQRGLEWLATVDVTEGTHLTGEAWYMKDGKVTTAVAPPHVWGMSLFYLASLEAYPASPADNKTAKE